MNILDDAYTNSTLLQKYSHNIIDNIYIRMKYNKNKSISDLTTHFVVAEQTKSTEIYICPVNTYSIGTFTFILGKILFSLFIF